MSKILDEWNEQIPNSVLAKQEKLNSRRRFLLACIGTAALPILNSTAVHALDNKKEQEPWMTIAAVQEHLFPSDGDAPGAEQIDAIQYLRNVIEHHDIETSEKEFIKNGVKWLNGLAMEIFSKNFISLNNKQKEKVLRKVSQSRAGENWISTLLSYIVEALLSAPAYGGNTNGVGWKWLEHQAGFPQPPKNKVYYRL